MNKIVLDSSIIKRFPDILSLNIPDTQLVTTLPIIRELSSNWETFSNKLEDLVQQTINIGRLKVESAYDKGFAINERKDTRKPMSAADLSVIALAERLRKEKVEDTIFVATEDRAIMEYCVAYGIRVIDTVAMTATISQEKAANHVDENTSKKIASIKRELSLQLISMIILISVLVLGGQRINRKIFRDIYDVIEIYGVVPLVIVTSGLLYLWRERHKIPYGAAEFVFGIGTVVQVLLENADHDAAFYVKMVGSLYLMVRGLDNFVKGAVKTTWGPFFTDYLKVGK